MIRAKLLAALAMASLLVAAGIAAWAQIGDQDPCVHACHVAKVQCIDTCDVHLNPVQCDEDCQEAAEDCIRQCR